MGMFDTIICKYPVEGKPTPFEDQTKSYECIISTVTIEEDGTLTRDFGEWDPATIAASEEYLATAKKGGFKEYFKLLDKRVWLSDVRRVDYTGSLWVDGVVFYFKRGKMVDSLYGSHDSPFTAPPYDIQQESTEKEL